MPNVSLLKAFVFSGFKTLVTLGYLWCCGKHSGKLSKPVCMRNVSHCSINLSINIQEVAVYFFLTPPDRIWQSRLLRVYTVNVTGQLLSRGPPASVQTFWKSSTVYTYLFHLFPPKQSKCKSRGNPSCETSTHTFQPCRAIGWRTSVKHQMSTFYSSINNPYHLYLWENKHVAIITLLLLK